VSVEGVPGVEWRVSGVSGARQSQQSSGWHLESQVCVCVWVTGVEWRASGVSGASGPHDFGGDSSVR
jgi:hypothetical protein